MRPFDTLDEVAVIDCETTGLDPGHDRVISVGVVLVDLRDDIQDCPTLDLTVNPGVPIPADATRIHGITDEDVKDNDSFGEVADKLIEFISDRPLVGFNVSFDKRFLNAELKRHGFKSFHRKRSHCVMMTLEEVWGYRPSLDNAIERMSLTRSGNVHNALNDALATMNIAGLLSRLTHDEISLAPGDQWSGIPDKSPTQRQLDYIRDLGGNASLVNTRREASEIIDLLKNEETVSPYETVQQKPTSSTIPKGCVVGFAVILGLVLIVIELFV